jgi:hypothetical protein
VKHHVKEEQTEMFPKSRKTSLDMHELGAQIASRKMELKASWQGAPQEPGLLARTAEAVA